MSTSGGDELASAEFVKRQVDSALAAVERMAAPYGGMTGVALRDPVLYRIRIERVADLLESLVARATSQRLTHAEVDRVAAEFVDAWRRVVEWIGGKKD